MATMMELPMPRPVEKRGRRASSQSDERRALVSPMPLLANFNAASLMPEAVLREMVAYFSIEELLVLEKVDVLWRDAVAASGAWRNVALRHEADTARAHRVLRLVAARHGADVRHIEVVNCAVADAIFIDIGPRFTKLETLVVSGCKSLTDDGFASLVGGSSDSLVEIRAVRCPMLSDAALEAANAHHASTLRTVDFSHCRFVTSAGVASLVHGASRLRSIGLKGCPKVNDRAVAAVAQHCPSLHALLLGGSGTISDEALHVLADHCAHLQSLDIARSNPFGIGRGGVSDSALLHLLSKCHAIERLVLRGQGRLTLTSLANVAVHCPNLQTLDIGGCRGIVQDPATLCALLKRMSLLEQLSVSFCGGVVEDEHVSAIAAECRQLKKFDVDGETIVSSPSV